MIKIGQILFTKDGRLTGNAIVIGSQEAQGLDDIYLCRTDFGNIFTLTAREIENQFHIDKNGVAFIDNPVRHIEDQMEKLAELHFHI